MSFEFYKKCSDILDVDHQYDLPKRKITRWNNRNPGNGRFENYGIIRYFSSNFIHVSFSNINTTFTNEQDVYDFLRDYKCLKYQ